MMCMRTDDIYGCYIVCASASRRVITYGASGWRECDNNRFILRQQRLPQREHFAPSTRTSILRPEMAFHLFMLQQVMYVHGLIFAQGVCMNEKLRQR